MPTMMTESIAPSAGRVKPQSANLPLGYLRAFVTVLVVAHHAALAYFPDGPRPVHSLLTNPRWWMAFPVNDTAKWIGFRPFVLWNDTCLMAVLFFVSGLFVWKSLQRKGPRVYLQDRLLRLGLPFALIFAVSPFAYYPAYLQGHLSDGYWHEWFRLGMWPSGPAWFLWSLLTFDLVGIVIRSYAANPFAAMGRWLANLDNPVTLAAIITLISGIAYLPMLVRFGPVDVFVHGPLLISKSRLFFYLTYFLFGMSLGTGGIPEKLLRPGGRLEQNWSRWTCSSVASFVLLMGCGYFSHRHWNPPLWTIVTGCGFVLSCGTSCFALLATFLHFVKAPKPVLDHLLSCAFGIYIVHYFFISWLQLGILSIKLPALLKGVVVFIVCLSLSWGLVAFARRSSLIARIL